MTLPELIRHYNRVCSVASSVADFLMWSDCTCLHAENKSDAIRILEQAFQADGLDRPLTEDDIETPAEALSDRPWHPLDIDRTSERVLIDGEPVPEGAALELSSDAGPVLVRLCEVTRAVAWARLELHATGAHDRIPVAVRLYSGALARLAHPAEGRRD